nr:6343_t:CDS:2 [Entrophospora candida]CAG8554359.1 10883_t:CDS:2 [Entrophospora candida]
MSSVTTFKRSKNAANSIREEETAFKGGSDGDRQQKPQFRDERFRRMELMIEFTNLRNPKHCPSGVYVMPSAEFYDVVPTIVFPSSTINNQGLFHPLVHAETGEFSLTQRFKDWTAHKYFIFHILHYIKKSFKKEVLDNLSEKYCLGIDAYKL